MKIVYKAFDGTEFDNESDCCYYENTLLADKDLIMLDISGNRTRDTRCAAVVWIRDKGANEVFHSLAKDCDDDYDAGSIPQGDFGVYYWHEGLEEYVWLSEDLFDALVVLNELRKELAEKEEEE